MIPLLFHYIYLESCFICRCVCVCVCTGHQRRTDFVVREATDFIVSDWKLHKFKLRMRLHFLGRSDISCELCGCIIYLLCLLAHEYEINLFNTLQNPCVRRFPTTENLFLCPPGLGIEPKRIAREKYLLLSLSCFFSLSFFPLSLIHLSIG